MPKNATRAVPNASALVCMVMFRNGNALEESNHFVLDGRGIAQYIEGLAHYGLVATGACELLFGFHVGKFPL